MIQTKFNTHLGNVLRDLRKSKGWTQQEFSAQTGFSRGTIANMETGRQAVSAHQAFMLASTLRLSSVDELFPMLPALAESEEDEIKIFLSHPSSDLSEDQVQQVQALARAAG